MVKSPHPDKRFLFWPLVVVLSLFVVLILTSLVRGCIPQSPTEPMPPFYAHLPPTLALPLEGDNPAIILHSRQFIPPKDIQQGLQWLRVSGLQEAHMLLQLYRPPDSETKQALEQAGIRLLERVSGNAWFASVPSDLTVDMPAVKLIRWLGPILPDDKLSVEVRYSQIPDWTVQPDGRILYEVHLFGDVSPENGDAIWPGESRVICRMENNRYIIALPEGWVLFLASKDEVKWIEHPVSPETVKNCTQVSD